MTTGVALIHTANVQRDTDPGAGDEFVTRHAAMPCRYYQTGATVEGENRILLGRLLCPLSYELEASDRIWNIVDGNNDEVAGVMYITSILANVSHREVELAGFQPGTTVEDNRNYIYVGDPNNPITVGGNPIYIAP